MPSNLYWICSKDVGGGPKLIGKLWRTGREDYRFQYCISKDALENDPWLAIYGFPYKNGEYNTEFVKDLLYRCVPRPNSKGIQPALRDYGLSEYNEWDILDHLVDSFINIPVYDGKQPYSDPRQRMYFYKELPGNVVRL